MKWMEERKETPYDEERGDRERRARKQKKNEGNRRNSIATDIYKGEVKCSWMGIQEPKGRIQNL